MASCTQAITKLLGETVLADCKSKSAVPSSSLVKDGGVIGLYCSAQWCPPCRVFTPVVIDFFQNWKRGPKADLLDIVFISSDNDESMFDDYYNEMPWKAIPYKDKAKRFELARKFKVTGIPALVFIDAVTGRLITADGRNVIQDDPEGKDFPWTPKPLGEYLKDAEFINNEGTTFTLSDFKGKSLGFYFSAEWCPPCRQFTPTLVNFYKQLNKKKTKKEEKMEIIFVSSDNDESSFNTYLSQMPFPALKYSDPLRSDLADHMNVSGIPKFVIYDENLKKVFDDGRVAVHGDPEAAEYPWKYKSVNILKDRFGRYLNEQICLLYLTDGKEESIQAAMAALQPLADEDRAEAGGEADAQSMHYFVTKPDEKITHSVTQHLDLPSDRPLMVVMDCAAREWVYYNGTLDSKGIAMFVSNYREGKLVKQTIKKER